MFLIDNNLSPKLVGRLQHIFPGITHVQDFGLEASDDPDIWNFAKQIEALLLREASDIQNFIANPTYGLMIIQ